MFERTGITMKRRLAGDASDRFSSEETRPRRQTRSRPRVAAYPLRLLGKFQRSADIERRPARLGLIDSLPDLPAVGFEELAGVASTSARTTITRSLEGRSLT